MLPQRPRRQRDLEPELVGELLRLGLEHDEQGLAAAPGMHTIGDVLVPEQVRVDRLERGEVVRLVAARHEHVRVVAVEGVEVGDVLECADPLVDAEDVVRGRRDEVDGGLARAHEPVDVREPTQPRPPRPARRRAPLCLRPSLAHALTLERAAARFNTNRQAKMTSGVRGTCRGRSSSGGRVTIVRRVTSPGAAVSRCTSHGSSDGQSSRTLRPTTS